MEVTEDKQPDPPKLRSSKKKSNQPNKNSKISENDDPDVSYKQVPNNSNLPSNNVSCCLCKNKESDEKQTVASLLEKINQLEKRIMVLEKNSNFSVNKKQSTTTGKTNINPITHQVIVTAEENETLSRKTFAEKVKANLSTVPINNISVSKEGLGVINFPDQSTRDDGLQKLKDDFSVKPNNRPHRNLLPKITIYNIDRNDYKNDDTLKLKKAICDKNPALKDLIEKNKIFDILFIKEDPRRNRSSMAVVKVDLEIYNAIKALQFQVFIDFSRCRITDRIHVTQCYICQKFGHMKSNCPMKNSSAQICRLCTENHNGKNCPHRGNYELYKCANCGLNHSTTYSGCNVLQNQVLSTAGRTIGLEDFSKNDIRPNVIVT